MVMQNIRQQAYYSTDSQVNELPSQQLAVAVAFPVRRTGAISAIYVATLLQQALVLLPTAEYSTDITDYAARRSQCSSIPPDVQSSSPADADGCITHPDKSCLTTKASQSRSRSAAATSTSTVRSSSTFGRAHSDRRAPH